MYYIIILSIICISQCFIIAKIINNNSINRKLLLDRVGGQIINSSYWANSSPNSVGSEVCRNILQYTGKSVINHQLVDGEVIRKIIQEGEVNNPIA